jgi:asparagine synthase (glutamine-hydrolysing)
LGANDGAYIFPLTICPFYDYRPVLNAAVRTFLDCDFPRGIWDEMSFWFGLPSESSHLFQSSLAKVRQPIDESSNQKFRFHEEVSQEHNLRKASLTGNRINGKDSWAYLRTAQFTTRPSHADQLHLDLWWRGLNVTQDAGTYLYNSDPPWNNSLTTALVHNTVTVNGCDQFRRAGRFLYLDWFDAFRDDSQATDPAILQRICGWHLGYRRQGFRHERTVTAYTHGNWQIRDDMLPMRNLRDKKPNIFRLHWLLPDWDWRMENGHPGIALRLLSPRGLVGLDIHVTGAESVSLDLVRAGVLVHESGRHDQISPVETAIRGWTSPTYAVKVPALSLAVEVKSAHAVQFTSEFYFPI